MASGDFFDKVQTAVEGHLTRQEEKRRIKREKQKARHPVLDWVDAFIWAVGWVLLANQYLVQAYQIPSGSMTDTLLIGDHIFVNKLVYGPELLPGLGKLPSPIKPARNDIIIFENPSYISRGAVFDVAQRVIYMLTISLVDIDRDERGQPRTHFLIKRAVGGGGDTFYNNRGNMDIRFAGETRAVHELDYNAAKGYTHKIRRMIGEEEYPALEAAARSAAFTDYMGLSPVNNDESGAVSLAYSPYQNDITYIDTLLSTLRGAFPQEDRYRQQLARFTRWYVPENRILPLGDNRDNSRDGRYFGPVRKNRVLGEALVRYWPLVRLGGLR